MATATREKQPFVPVVLKLENQDEVDALFAICNFTPINDRIRILRGVAGALTPYKVSYLRYHSVLQDLLQYC